jgi:hypothetical protein
MIVSACDGDDIAVYLCILFFILYFLMAAILRYWIFGFTQLFFKKNYSEDIKQLDN